MHHSRVRNFFFSHIERLFGHHLLDVGSLNYLHLAALLHVEEDLTSQGLNENVLHHSRLAEHFEVAARNAILLNEFVVVLLNSNHGLVVMRQLIQQEVRNEEIVPGRDCLQRELR